MSSILKKLALKSYKSCIMQSRRNFLGITKSYRRTLEKRPYLVQAIQAGILMGAGDLIAQKFFADTEAANIDYIRTLKFFSIGFLLIVRTHSELNIKWNSLSNTLSNLPIRVLPFAFGTVLWTKPLKQNHHSPKRWSKSELISWFSHRFSSLFSFRLLVTWKNKTFSWLSTN